VQVSLVVDILLNPLRGTISSSKGVSMNISVSTKYQAYQAGLFFDFTQTLGCLWS